MSLTNQERALAKHVYADQLLTKEKEDPNHITTTLDKYNVTSFNTGFFHGFKSGYISGLEDAGEWMPYPENKPELHEDRYSDRVLCLTSSGHMEVGFMVHDRWIRDIGRGRFEEDGGYVITHWMPLPKKPVK